LKNNTLSDDLDNAKIELVAANAAMEGAQVRLMLLDSNG
jgi:hypothetical protein